MKRRSRVYESDIQRAKPNKYGAVKVKYQGCTFDSKKEFERYLALEDERKRGRICELAVHPRYDLQVNGHWICTYEADFRYIRAGEVVIEDAKGMKKGAAWQMFRIKAALMKALHGIDVQVV